MKIIIIKVEKLMWWRSLLAQ